MTNIDRRTVLAGAAAVTAFAVTGAGLPRAGGAAVPKAEKQAPGFYRYKVGDYEITVVTDGARSFPLPDNFVVNASKADVNAALEAAYMPKDMMTLYYSPIVVNTGSKLVLIDTGYGPADGAKPGSTTGLLAQNLAAAGIDAKAIDTVIISHFHGDHVNGLLDANNQPTFPNAEIKVPAAEYKYWMDDGEMSRAPAGRMQDLFKGNRKVFNDEIKKRVATYDWDKEVAPGILAQGTPGHTPGHTSYVIASGSGKVFVQSDVTNNPALFVRNPAWHAFFDQDGNMAEATRKKVYEMLVAEKMLVQGFHYPFPSLGHVEKDGNGYRLAPVPWTSQL
jgi:glyoxylase-like metal-dependent hydrolase (beta-lactamase superfamily II)